MSRWHRALEVVYVILCGALAVLFALSAAKYWWSAINAMLWSLMFAWTLWTLCQQHRTTYIGSFQRFEGMLVKGQVLVRCTTWAPTESMAAALVTMTLADHTMQGTMRHRGWAWCWVNGRPRRWYRIQVQIDRAMVRKEATSC